MGPPPIRNFLVRTSGRVSEARGLEGFWKGYVVLGYCLFIFMFFVGFFWVFFLGSKGFWGCFTYLVSFPSKKKFKLFGFFAIFSGKGCFRLNVVLGDCLFLCFFSFFLFFFLEFYFF